MPINLLPHKKSSFTQKFFSWVLTFGRIIIVLTELVVLVAFLSRFKLDRELIDLHDQIKQEGSVVKSLENVEKRSRNLQERLLEISRIDKEAKNSTDFLQKIPTLIPVTVFLDSLTLDEKTLKIDARALNGTGVSSFVKKLRDSRLFSDVNLDHVTRDESLGGQIKFTITASANYANTNR